MTLFPQQGQVKVILSINELDIIKLICDLSKFLFFFFSIIPVQLFHLWKKTCPNMFKDSRLTWASNVHVICFGIIFNCIAFWNSVSWTKFVILKKKINSQLYFPTQCYNFLPKIFSWLDLFLLLFTISISKPSCTTVKSKGKYNL